MKDFDLRKYMSNNPLHQSNIGGFSITELKQINLDDLTEADIAYGYSIIKELNLNSEIELLDEGLKDFIKGIKDKLKGLKPTEQLLSVLFAKIKKSLPSGINFKKFITDLSKWAQENKGKITDKSLKKYLDTKELNEITLGEKASQIGAGFLLTLKTAAIIASMLVPNQAQAATDKVSDNLNQIEAAAEETGENLDSVNSIEFGDAAKLLNVDDDVENEVSDLVNDFGKYLASDVDDDGFEFWMDNGIGDVDDTDIQKIIDQAIDSLKSKFPNLKKITLTDNATWTNTQGDDASDDKALDGGSVSKDRQNTANKINKLLKKAIEDNFEGADVTHVEKDAVKDSSKEYEAGSLDAKKQQKVGSTWSDIDPGDDKDVVPDDTDDDSGDDDIKTASPKDIIAFYSKKPTFDKSKYEVIFMHILPFIIGNGEDGITKSNPEFEKIIKYFFINDKPETLNDAFINRRIGTDGILRKRLEKAKGEDKEGIENAIKVLTWLRNTKKSPKTIENFLNKLNPNLQVGEKRAFSKTDTQFQKGEKTTPSKGRQQFKGKGATKTDPNPTNMMERLVFEIKSSLLLEFNANLLPNYNESAAKENIGHLLPIYTTIFKGKATDDSDGTITYNVDAIYDYDEKGEPSIKPEYAKSEAYFQKYFNILPDHKEQAKKINQTKEKDTKKTSDTTKTTSKTTSTTTSKPTDVKVGDTIELDPKVKSKSKQTTTKRNTKSFSDTEDQYKNIIKAKDKIVKNLSSKDKSKTPDDIALKTDFKKGEDPASKDAQKAGDQLGKHKDLALALDKINTQDEFEGLVIALLSFVSPNFLLNTQLIKKALLKSATTNFDKTGKSDDERQKMQKNISTTAGDVKVNYKLTEDEDETLENVDLKDVEKVRSIIARKNSLVTALKKINTTKELEDFLLMDLIEKLNKIFIGKHQNLIQGLKSIVKQIEKNPTFLKSAANTSDQSLTKEQIKSLIKNIITEGLTPSQTAKVKDKYKQIYSGMLKGNKKKLLKYIDPKFGRPNPDAMATGRAINLVKKENDENVEEAKTEKQRRWACAQVDSKSRPKGLSKAQAKEICSDTNLSKNESMENTRLTELIKTALKGPLNEATDLVDKHGYQFTRFSMGEKGPGLQIVDKSSKNPSGTFIQIPGSKLGFFASALTDAIRVFDDMSRQLPVDENKFTSKYNDHPKLTNKQKNLPDALQKGILGLEEDNIDEAEVNEMKMMDFAKLAKMEESKEETLSERILKELRK